MMFTRFLFLLLALTLTLPLHAAPVRAADAASGNDQATSETPPRPRLPEGDFAAKVEVTDTHEAARQDELAKKGLKVEPVKRPIMQTMAVKKLRGKTLYQIKWLTGASTQIWQDDASGMRVEELPNGSVYIPRDGATMMPDLASLTAPSIAWIRPVTDKKEQTSLNGRECTRYERVMIFPHNLKITYQAWIDRKTGLPVMLDDSSALYKIEFDSQIPTGELVIPAKFQQEIERVIRELKAPSYL